jgi:NAD(P)-dependent dehydrogenase (short-subunit alcohol dehydrogenase family)
MDIRLDNQVIIITGASRGIGLATAQLAVASGARVVITGRRQENLDVALASFGDQTSRVCAVVAHAGRSSDADRVVRVALEHFGRLDGLVNNAATNPYYGPLVGIDDQRMAKTVDTNQSSALYHVRAAWREAMASQGGAIVNVASVGGLGPEPGIGWYNVTKAALIHLTRQLSWELAPTVRVNAVAPGLVRTELARGLWEERGDEIARAIPLQRLGTVEDIARGIVFLLSDSASWITGHTLVIDGGTTTQPSGGVG